MQIVEVLGALAVLAAYVADLRGSVSTDDLSYASLNLVGAGVLSVVAVLTGQWGFLLLQGAWALLALHSVVRIVRGSRSGAPRGRANGRRSGGGA